MYLILYVCFIIILRASAEIRYDPHRAKREREAVAAPLAAAAAAACGCSGVPLPVTGAGTLLAGARQAPAEIGCCSVGRTRAARWWGQLGKAAAAATGMKPVCSAARLPQAAGRELGGEYPEQSGAVRTSFCLMSEAL